MNVMDSRATSALLYLDGVHVSFDGFHAINNLSLTLAPGNSIEAVIWVAVGGRGTLIGAALGAVVVNYAKTVFTSGPLAPYWLFMLGALFILVTLLLPKGIIGTFNAWWEPRKANRLSANAVSAEREDGISEPNPAE